MSYTDSMRGHNLTILVVHREAETGAVIADFLESCGYSVVLAETITKALELLLQGPAPALLLAQVDLGEMSGIELADYAAERYPEIKIILMSDSPGGQCLDYRSLKKTFQMKDLRAAARAELASCGFEQGG